MFSRVEKSFLISERWFWTKVYAADLTESHKQCLSKGPVIINRRWGEDFWGDHLIFRITKGGISRNWEPKRGDHWKLWKDSEGDHSNLMLGGLLQWSNIPRGDWLNLTMFSPKSSALPHPPPPRRPAVPPSRRPAVPQAINNDRSLNMIKKQERLMGQRGNLRVLAGILLEIFLEVVLTRMTNSWDVRTF